MEHEYWDKFWETGNVTDYLSYTSKKSVDIYGRKHEEDVGVCYSESDCTDRDGTVYSARWGV